jgi:hypothetical protein
MVSPKFLKLSLIRAMKTKEATREDARARAPMFFCFIKLLMGAPFLSGGAMGQPPDFP